MPYDNVDLDCGLVICSNNERKECQADCHVDELMPGNISCRCFGFIIGDETDWTWAEDIEELLELIEENNIPYLSIDDDSTHFETIRLSDKAVGVCRGNKEDIKEFRFWKSVDGGMGATHKDQLELDLKGSLK